MCLYIYTHIYAVNRLATTSAKVGYNSLDFITIFWFWLASCGRFVCFKKVFFMNLYNSRGEVHEYTNIKHLLQLHLSPVSTPIHSDYYRKRMIPYVYG